MYLFLDNEEKKSWIWFLLGYPNTPGSTFENPGGLSLKDLVIIPQIGVGLAFAFRSDNQGYLQTLFFFKMIS